MFWGTFAVGALIACFTYIPMAELSQKLFVAASTRQLTWFFPQRMNNAVMLWAVLNGTVGFLMFWLSYRFFGSKHGVTPDMWGVQTSPARLLRTLSLAVTLFVCYFLFLFTVYYFFHVDYRFLFMGVRVFQPALLPLLFMYAPFFFIFFLSNSLRVNAAMRFEGQPEWRSMLLGGVANSLGLLLIVIVQYVTFAATGMVYWTDGWLYVNLLFAVVPMMFVLPYLQSLLLPHDRLDLPGPDDHLPDLRHDPDHQHGHLPAAGIKKAPRGEGALKRCYFLGSYFIRVLLLVVYRRRPDHRSSRARSSRSCCRSDNRRKHYFRPCRRPLPSALPRD